MSYVVEVGRSLRTFSTARQAVKYIINYLKDNKGTGKVRHTDMLGSPCNVNIIVSLGNNNEANIQGFFAMFMGIHEEDIFIFNGSKYKKHSEEWYATCLEDNKMKEFEPSDIVEVIALAEIDECCCCDVD